MLTTLRFIFLITLGFFVLASCKVTKKYERAADAPSDLYRQQAGADSSSLAQLPFKELFRDSILYGLIREGVDNNLNLQVALTRIQQSGDLFRQTRAGFLPTLNGTVNVSQSKLAYAQGFGILTDITQFQLNLASRWEIDIWGRLKSTRKASLAALLRSQATARTVQTSLVASIANNYYLLLALDKQKAITEQTVRNWDSTVVTMQSLKIAAIVTEAAVVQSEAQRHATQVTLPDLRQRIRETEDALSVLLGRSPAPIQRGKMDDQEPVAVIRAGLPIQLLANRPDVMDAEMAYRNAFELTNVARATLYPTFAITGSAGLLSLSIKSFFDPAASTANIGGGVSQPFFNGRQLRTNLSVAKKQQQIAMLQLKNSLLVAGQEVSDAISLHATALEKAETRTKQIAALEKSVDYTQELLKSGFANYTEVITARQSLLNAQLGRVNDKLQQLQATVNLYRSLGGGWNVD